MANPDDVRLELIRQHWEHFRHQETERGNFTIFFGLIVAGIFAFIAEASPENPRLLLWVLAGLATFGLLLTLRTWANLQHIQSRLKRLADGTGVPNYYVIVAAAGLHLEPPLDRREKVQNFTRIISWQGLVPLIYLLAIVVFALLSVWGPLSGSTSSTASGKAGAINYGHEVNNKVKPTGTEHLYTFEGKDGDKALIVVTEIAGEDLFNLQVKLYDPQGKSVGQGSASPGRPMVRIEEDLRTTGKYKILVQNANDYHLTLNNLANP